MSIGVQNSLISVVVPIYNVELYLEKCIDSIVNQTYSNLEIILVDDGSTDGSPQICDRYAYKDSRIKIIHKENGGLVSARKAGIQIATGHYAAYVDGDDWIEADMYEVLIRKIGSADMIICGVERDYGKNIFYEINKVEEGVYEGKELEEKLYKKMIFTGDFFERGIQPHIYNGMFKTEILRHNQMQVNDEVRVGEDAACLYPTLLDAQKIVVVSYCPYHYQMRENSIMGVNDKKELERYRVWYFYLKGRFLKIEKLHENLMYQLKNMMLYFLMLKEIEVLQGETNVLFPYGEIGKKDRIVVYGAGRFGCELVNYIHSCKDYTLVLWVDKNARNDVKHIEEIKEVVFDYILVAVLIKDISKEMIDSLLQMGIPKEKIKSFDTKQIERKVKEVEKILMFSQRLEIG